MVAAGQGERRRAGVRRFSSFRFGADFAGALATTGAMYPPLIRPLPGIVPGFVALALLASAPPAVAVEQAWSAATMDAMAQAASPQAIAEYRRKLKEYQEARAAFEEEAAAYWSSISEKRRGRNAKRRERQQIALDDYVLTQPPVYTGPKRPVSPQPEEEEERPPRRAQDHSRSRRFPQGRRRTFPVHPASACRPRSSSSAPMRATPWRQG